MGRLFLIDTDMQVGESANDFDAIGCGRAYALGALAATLKFRENRDPEGHIRTALAFAERFSGGVRGPYTVLHLPHAS
jgi:ATP-dependent protease HslVU (ClpYQ) peptidase subunit